MTAEPTIVPPRDGFWSVLDVRMTPEQDALLAALSAFQGDCPVVDQDREVDAGRVKYGYTSLSHARKEIAPLLAEHKLSVQSFVSGTNVVVRLGHESGQWVMTSATMKITAMHGREDTDAQAFGSAVSYFRRYMELAILGIASDRDDDDGQQASTPPQRANPTSSAPPSAPSSAPSTTPSSTGTARQKSDQRWFGHDEQGQLTGWVSEVRALGQAGKVHLVILTSGEELKTFSHEDAGVLSRCIGQKLGVNLLWKREVQEKYDDSFVIQRIAPLQPDQNGPEQAIAATILKVEAAGQEVWRVDTDRGKFGCTVAALVTDANSKLNQEHRMVFTPTQRGRLLARIEGIADEPAGTINNEPLKADGDADELPPW